MDREKLVRAHFDAYSDLVWAEDLEPKFKQYDLSAAEMKQYREAWNRHTEARDWDWWLENVKKMSNAELRQEIAECHSAISALRGEAIPTEKMSELSRALAGEVNERPKGPEPEKEKDRGRER